MGPRREFDIYVKGYLQYDMQCPPNKHFDTAALMVQKRENTRGLGSTRDVCIPLFFLVRFARDKHQQHAYAWRPSTTHNRCSEVLSAPGLSLLEAVRIGKSVVIILCMVWKGMPLDLLGEQHRLLPTLSSTPGIPFQTAGWRPQHTQYRLP